MDHDIDRRLLLGAAGLVGAAAIGKLAHAGPLNPPVGAVASTGRTLLEVEPRIPVGPTTTPGSATGMYRISQPGSYYLTGNVQAAVGKHGIEITASGVTLDLMGFELRGVGSAAGAGPVLNGVSAGLSLSRVVVRNGTLTGWDGAGVSCYSPGSVLEGLTASACLVGLRGSNGPITGCTAVANGKGIETAGAATLTACVAADNLEDGFVLTHAAVCNGCVAQGNGAHGFRLSNSGIANECVAFENSGVGFACNSSNSIVRCRADRNGQGIDVSQSGRVIDCVVENNTNGGIEVGTRSFVSGNTCIGNRATGVIGYGIMINGNGSRVEGNYSAFNTRGISVDGTGNLVVRNFVHGNTEYGYLVPAGNLFGPNVFNQAGIAGSTNPHANYEG